MRVCQISGPPSSAQARALAEFEVPFTYPLGAGRFFRITHGEDYTLFFRVLGEQACFVAEYQDRMVGALGTAVRRLWLPDGSELAAAYLGDLKIAANARGGAVLARLARVAEAWLRPRVGAAYGVVMGGTALSPGEYTGRAGIPAFTDLGRLVVFRLSVRDDRVECDPGHFLTTPEAGIACYRRLSLGRYACPLVEASRRSQITPIWLMNPDGSACGMLEDTRKAKRLISGDGSEMLSAHLSYFGCNTIAAGAKLLGVALRQLARLRLPALFVAVPESDAKALRESLPNVEILAAPATVFGTGLAPGSWNINSSEI